MNVFRYLLSSLLVFLPCAAFAEGDCEDAFLECKDDCLIEFGGSTRVEVKKAYDKCMKRCTKTARGCGERVMETKASGLDEGALDGTPASDEERAPAKKKKKVAAEVAADDSSDDEPAKKKEALGESEVPKSNRTTLKTDDAPPPPKKKEKDPPKEERVEAPRKEVIEMKMTPRKDEEDLRDDKPRASAPAEAEAPPKKKKIEPLPKRKEEDHDDLRNY